MGKSALPKAVTGEDLRQNIVSRINRFQKLTGWSDHRIGLEAVNDGSYVTRLRRGEVSGLKTMDKLQKWLDTVVEIVERA